MSCPFNENDGSTRSSIRVNTIILVDVLISKLSNPDETLKALTAICNSMCGTIDQFCSAAISKDEAKLDMTMLKDCIKTFHDNLTMKTEAIDLRVMVILMIILTIGGSKLYKPNFLFELFRS